MFRSLSFRKRFLQSQTRPAKFRGRCHWTRHCVLWINRYHFFNHCGFCFCFDISWFPARFPATFNSARENLLHSLLKLTWITLEHNQWSQNAWIYSKSLRLLLKHFRIFTRNHQQYWTVTIMNKQDLKLNLNDLNIYMKPILHWIIIYMHFMNSNFTIGNKIETVYTTNMRYI